MSITALIKLKRWYNPDCTIGRASIGKFQFFTLELLYAGNLENVSCIPEGIYEYFLRDSPSKGSVLELKEVRNRSFIQLHAGNYTSQILGCILVGDGIKWLNDDGIPDVTNSKRTLKKLLKYAGDSGFIEITS